MGKFKSSKHLVFYVKIQELLKKAFEGLYPDDIDGAPELKLKYSGRFSDYNGNVSMLGRRGMYSSLTFSLSRKFSDVDEDIQIGILQHLLNRVYRTNVKSTEQDFYHSFIKHLTDYADRQESDTSLIELFHELNEEYFNGIMNQPNLVFGRDSKTTMGHYNYAKDLVTLSTILKDDRELLKFVMYHELLHKKHKFKTSSAGRSQYHTSAFRSDERKYSVKDIEKQLEKFVAKKRMKGLFKWF